MPAEYSVLFYTPSNNNGNGPPVPYRSHENNDSTYVDLKSAETDREQVNVDSLMMGDNLVRIILPSGQVSIPPKKRKYLIFILLKY